MKTIKRKQEKYNLIRDLKNSRDSPVSGRSFINGQPFLKKPHLSLKIYQYNQIHIMQTLKR